MGAGKTALTQGIAAGLDVTEPVSSPTFTLVHEYEGRLPVWHLDAYRLQGTEEAVDLGIEEMTAAGGVIIVEWPERIESLVPPDRLAIHLEITGDEERRLRFEACGVGAEGRLREFWELR